MDQDYEVLIEIEVRRLEITIIIHPELNELIERGV